MTHMFLHLSFFAMLLTFLMQRNHFLMSLFSLEGMMLTLVAMIPLSLMYTYILIPTISVMLLTFGACEASLGLGLMVMMSRYYGNDMYKSLNSSMC